MLGCSKIKGIFYIPLHGGGGGGNVEVGCVRQHFVKIEV